MRRTATGGFTLIELLVVVSIIGMLASIILVALNGARQKGIQAAALEFATTNYHAWGADAYIRLSFDNQDMSDSAGNYTWSPGISGGVLGTDYAFSQDTPNGNGYSLNMKTATFNYRLTNTANIAKPLPYTVSVWVKPDPSFSGGSVVFLGSGPGGPITMLLSSLTSLTVGPVSSTHAFPVNIPSGLWTQISYSWDNAPSPTMNLYVNGNKAGSYQFASNSAIGGYWSNFVINGSGLIGSIDDISVYNQVLSESDIQREYAIGRSRIGIASR